MSEEAKAKIRGMSKGDIRIAERRGLYNHMGRRFKNPQNLKAGLLEKYLGCVSSKNERFNLLKEFLIDENLWVTKFSTEIVSVQFAPKKHHMYHVLWFERVAFLGLKWRWKPISYSPSLGSLLLSLIFPTSVNQARPKGSRKEIRGHL